MPECYPRSPACSVKQKRRVLVADTPQTTDPNRPLPVGAPFFRDDLDAWVLTRYGDVSAALRSPGLWPVPARKKKNAKVPDRAALQLIREQVAEAFSSVRLAAWQAALTRRADELQFQSGM